MNLTEVKDRVCVMRRQEDVSYKCSDYLKSYKPVNDIGIDQLCRLKMTNWCFNVIDFIQFRRETVCIAMSYLDRFLCTYSPRAKQVINTRKEYQLAAMTTLFMAIKINEPLTVDTSFLVDLSKGLYSHHDFQKMETDILFALDWKLNGPTAQAFTVHLLTLIQKDLPFNDMDRSCQDELHEILELATHQIELSLGNYELMTQKSSVVAIASIWNSVDHLTSHTFSHDSFYDSLTTLASNIGTSIEDVTSTRQSLEKINNMNNEAKNISVMRMRASLTTIMEVQSSSSSSSSSSKDERKSCSPISVRKIF